jgi:hypothetical protein
VSSGSSALSSSRCFCLWHRHSQLDQQLLAAVISLRTPELTVFASTVTRLGSTPMVVYLGLAAAVVLWFRSRSIVLPIALLAALVATESLVTILKIALDRPRPPAGLVVGVPLSDDAFPSVTPLMARRSSC